MKIRRNYVNTIDEDSWPKTTLNIQYNKSILRKVRCRTWRWKRRCSIYYNKSPSI